MLTKSDSGIGGCPIACSFVPSPPAPPFPGDTALFVPGVPWGHSTFAFPAFQGTQHVCAFPGVQHFWTGECPLPCSLSPRIVAGLLAWYTAVICRLLYIFLRFEGGGPGGTVFRGCSGGVPGTQHLFGSDHWLPCSLSRKIVATLIACYTAVACR